MLRAQVELLEERAAFGRVPLAPDPYVFSDDIAGQVPWKPDAVSQYFGRLRQRTGLAHLDFHSLRKFVETYGQEMGYSVAQVRCAPVTPLRWRRSTTAAASSRPTVSWPRPLPRC